MIALYTVIVISTIADNFIKPLIIDILKERLQTDQNNRHHIHSIVIFFSIFAGLSSFGFWGMIIGPAVTTLFLTLLYIYGDTKVAKS